MRVVSQRLVGVAIVLVGALTFLFVTAGVATAATVSADTTISDVIVTFEAEPGESNDLTVSLSPEADRIVFDDTGAAITPGNGCSGGGAPGVPVECPLPTGDGFRFLTVEIQAGDGNDTVDTTGIPEFALQGISATSVFGGPGDDVILTGASWDDVRAGTGNDSVSTGEGQDIIQSGPDAEGDGTDVLDGGADSDRVSYETRTSALSITLDSVANDGSPYEGDNVIGIEEAEGGSGDDVIIGDDADNVLYGGGGSDHMLGAGGNDALFDEARFTSGTGSDELLGGDGHDFLFGGTLNDTLFGGAGADWISGGDADDVVAGGSGDDTLWGQAGSDDVRGMSGNDVIDGGSGDDRVRGDLGADRLRGSSGSDRMIGGDGADVIDSAFKLVGEAEYRKRENRHDRVDCGPEEDRAKVDHLDDVRSCESTTRIK